MSAPLRPRDVAPDDLDRPFWEGCRRGEFLLHTCTTCGRRYWPASCCIEHGAAAMRWEPGSATGAVHTFTVFRHAYDPAMAERIPYVVAVIELDDGPFFHTDLVDCHPDDVRVGMRVHATFEAVDDEDAVPHFRPTDSEATAPPSSA